MHGLRGALRGGPGQDPGQAAAHSCREGQGAGRACRHVRRVLGGLPRPLPPHARPREHRSEPQGLHRARPAAPPHLLLPGQRGRPLQGPPFRADGPGQPGLLPGGHRHGPGPLWPGSRRPGKARRAGAGHARNRLRLHLHEHQGPLHLARLGSPEDLGPRRRGPPQGQPGDHHRGGARLDRVRPGPGEPAAGPPLFHPLLHVQAQRHRPDHHPQRPRRARAAPGRAGPDLR